MREVFDVDAWNASRRRRQRERREEFNRYNLGRLYAAIERHGIQVECQHMRGLPIDVPDLEIDGVIIEEEPADRCLRCGAYLVPEAEESCR